MTRTPTSDPDVFDNVDASRYEIYSGSELAGFAMYSPIAGGRRFIHTEIEPARRGNGLATRLIGAALGDVRSRHMAASPICPYVVDYLRRHGEYLDLVPKAERAKATAPYDRAAGAVSEAAKEGET